MIAQFLQRLTLIAFTAHAVLGCCWHHSHAVGEDRCHRHAHRAEIDAGPDCCGHLADQRSGPATIDDCQDGPRRGVEPSRGAERTSLSNLAWDECPYGHSHRCDEDSCHYVPRQASSANALVGGSVADLAPTAVDLFAFAGIDVRCDADRAFGLPVPSSRQRCANLQSWQI